MFAFGEPVTILSAGTSTDDYGNAVEDWSTPVERPESCAVADGGSTETQGDARTPVDSDFDLIFDHDPAVSAQNRVRVRGLDCSVVRRPFSWRSPFTGWEPGTVVRVSIVEG
jgi:hypothetical protein